MKYMLVVTLIAFCLFGCTNTRKASHVYEGKIALTALSLQQKLMDLFGSLRYLKVLNTPKTIGTKDWIFRCAFCLNKKTHSK